MFDRARARLATVHHLSEEIEIIPRRCRNGGNGASAWQTYGFMDEPEVSRDLMPATSDGPWKDRQPVSYILARVTLLPTAKPEMYLWREALFIFMSRNAQPATLFFHLPVEQVIE